MKQQKLEQIRAASKLLAAKLSTATGAIYELVNQSNYSNQISTEDNDVLIRAKDILQSIRWQIRDELKIERPSTRNFGLAHDVISAVVRNLPITTAVEKLSLMQLSPGGLNYIELKMVEGENDFSKKFTAVPYEISSDLARHAARSYENINDAIGIEVGNFISKFVAACESLEIKTLAERFDDNLVLKGLE